MRIAALGYYGFGNLGDEAVLAGIHSALKSRQCFEGAELLVLSNAPEETCRLHPGTRAADRWDWRGVSRSLSGTDLFILGGGSLLQDATSVKSVLWYSLMARIARAKSRRVLWWGQGVGPLSSRMSRFLVRHIANQADAITVRDKKSAELLKDLGVKGSIELVADPAFALTPARHATPNPPSVLVALRSWQGNTWLQRILAGQEEPFETILREGTRTDRQTLRGLAMHQPEDAEMMPLTGMTSMTDWRTDTIENTLGTVAQSSLMIAMRLHALIFAARCGVPFVALSYDPKVDALATACGQEDALLNVNYTSLTRERLVETIVRVRDTGSRRRDELKEFAAIQTVKATRPAEIAAEMLG